MMDRYSPLSICRLISRSAWTCWSPTLKIRWIFFSVIILIHVPLLFGTSGYMDYSCLFKTCQGASLYTFSVYRDNHLFPFFQAFPDFCEFPVR